MSQFKVGDRVVFFRDVSSSESRNKLLGKIITLAPTNGAAASYGSKAIWSIKEMPGYVIRFEEIEHEHVYNSPLYKALS